MNINLTEIVLIIDKSGSMHGLEKDTIGGINRVIEENRIGEGKVLVTAVFFNGFVDFIYSRMDIKDVELLSDKNYKVGGGTALLDAISVKSMFESHCLRRS